MKLLVINGPNLNMLGRRESEHYGKLTLGDIEKRLQEECSGDLDFFQSNSEGNIVSRIQQAGEFDGIIINAGAYTHTSIAIRDALLSVKIPFVEVHLSNVYAREDFRHKSYLSDIAEGVIAGFGADSYSLALRWFESR
ncbi:type II 3-dehydroquinate dehydratase [Limisalsivibrio acetivorans]|uniref:type II 3-dehydroquinate dehydratase n=1 Tax=Limisalsivibrio acetivorans TaxID=1304888 RepID=UPI0003B48BC7|nr:type II 3-dehydroquinate dehydratase [Limisalsivibrio acetivorans]